MSFVFLHILVCEENYKRGKTMENEVDEEKSVCENRVKMVFTVCDSTTTPR